HPANESFPWAGDVLAARLVRFLNIGVGALTVVLTYATAVLMWPRNRAMAVGSSAILAFSPMFLYMSGTINNDVIAALSGAAVMYASVRLLLSDVGFGGDEEPFWRSGVRWGVVMGAAYALALMSKFNLAPIAATQVLVMTFVAWRHKQWGAWVVSGVAMFLSTAVLAGWWFLRNTLIYGEPTGVETLTELWGVRTPSESFWLVIQELPNAWSSLWGRFGFGQIPLPGWFYTAVWVATLAAGGGLVWAFVRAIKARRVARNGLAAVLLFLLVSTFFAVLFAYMLISPAGAMGRFFFPGLPALVILLFAGLALWPVAGRWEALDTPAQMTQSTAVVISVLMAVAAVWALVGFLAPAYAAPPRWSAEQALPNPMYLQFNEMAALRGYEIVPTAVRRLNDDAGETQVRVDLYWEVLNQPIGNFYLFAHLMDSVGTMVTQRDTHPALGKFPTSEWRPGDRFVDTVYLWLPATAYPDTAVVSVGLYAPSGYRLAVTDAAGELVGDTAVLGNITIEPRLGKFPNPLSSAQSFEQRVRLVGYEYAEDNRTAVGGETLTLTLYWEIL
ncbi:MAG: phospholipid carrier-dependent glycosyltransferase, partial [Anaerolineales bacterium]|nr:phospholipid carrier-dependent glycosyltransferase [Anaerolineales bacterium]